jgi:hypothetical protein
MLLFHLMTFAQFVGDDYELTSVPDVKSCEGTAVGEETAMDTGEQPVETTQSLLSTLISSGAEGGRSGESKKDGAASVGAAVSGGLLTPIASILASPLQVVASMSSLFDPLASAILTPPETTTSVATPAPVAGAEFFVPKSIMDAEGASVGGAKGDSPTAVPSSLFENCAFSNFGAQNLFLDSTKSGEDGESETNPFFKLSTQIFPVRLRFYVLCCVVLCCVDLYAWLPINS